MLKLLKKLFTESSKPEIDPKIFNHPLALKTLWTPQKKGGSNIKTRKLVKTNTSRLEFKPTNLVKFTSGLFLIFPFIFGFFALREKEVHTTHDLIFLAIPVIFIGFGIYMLYTTFRPIVFDKKFGYFFKSYQKPVSIRDIKDEKQWIPLNDIKALQLIAERVKTKNSSYQSYELNIVNADGGRYNIVDHGAYESLRKDAKLLADFIGIPFWDAVALDAYTPQTLQRKQQSSYSSVDDLIEIEYDDDEVDTDKPYNSLKRRKL